MENGSWVEVSFKVLLLVIILAFLFVINNWNIELVEVCWFRMERRIFFRIEE
jgi:hypothetical protein